MTDAREERDDTSLNLTGDWVGSFSYPRARPPVTFRAALQDVAGRLTGATEEAGNTAATKGMTLAATLLGVRDGRQVRFLKTYDGEVRGYDAVQYEGELSPDGTEIDGRWTVPGNWSGEFVMVRKGHPYAVAARSAAAKVGAR